LFLLASLESEETYDDESENEEEGSRNNGDSDYTNDEEE